MGRESSIDFEAVALAANKIKADGGKPTTRTVRELLNHGSMATISKFLRMWKSGQINHNQIGDEILDPSITSAISSYVAIKLQEAATNYLAQVTELESDSDMLIVECERYAEELADKTYQLSELGVQHTTLIGRVQQLESDATRTAAELSSERQSAEAARIALAKAELRLEALPRMETELEKLRADLLDARTQSALFSEASAVAKAKYEAEIEHRRRA
jgi:colicin import membrane protein